MRGKLREWFGGGRKWPTGYVAGTECSKLKGAAPLTYKRKIKVYDSRMVDSGGF